jgi:diacylglycerol O-acyltransferase / wax synthase
VAAREAPPGALEPLAPEDLEILRLESPTVAGHTLKVAILDPPEGEHPPDAEALGAHISERIERAPRLRRRVQIRAGRRSAAWVDDPAFDTRRHVRARPLAEPVSHDELGRICARLMEERLDRSRPLWTIDVLAPLEEGGAAVIWRVHHSIADGATAMRLAEQVLWDPRPGSGGRSGGGGGIGAAGPSGAREPARPLAELREALSARRPARLPGTLRRELRRTRHPSPFDGVIGASREVAFVSVPLNSVRGAAKELVPAATVNDTVLALVAGGLRRWAEARGDPLGTVRVKVPVSLHSGAESAEAANRDSFFCVALPIAEPDPVERLRRINADTAVRKRAGDPRVLDTLLRDAGRVAPPLRRLLERFTLHPQAFALNVSNVPGPAERPSVLGAPVRAFYSVAEIRERHGLRVAVISMANELHFGLCADPAIVGDLDPLVMGILTEASTLGDRSRAEASAGPRP